MFGDLGEQEYRFELIEELSGLPDDTDLIETTALGYFFDAKIKGLQTEIERKEQETIQKGTNPRHNLQIGFSYESQLLCQLAELILLSNTPPKLRENLSELKVKLLQAMVLDRDVKNDNLSFMAKKGKERTEQMSKLQKKGAAAVTKFTDDDRGGWVKQAEELLESKPELSLNAMAKTICKREFRPETQEESIRKELSKHDHLKIRN